jgi:hypothetical protein
VRHALRLAFVLAAGLLLEPRGAGAIEGTPFSGALQLDLTNAYFFRGILNERDGIIVQPWGELYVNTYASDDGLIRDVTLGFGAWASIHSEETLASESPTSVYELDLYPLVSVGLAGGLTLTTTYYFYESPNGAWSPNVEELNFKLEWDDSEVLGFPLAPWVNVAVETDGTSFGAKSGTGIQFGVEPTVFETEGGFSVSVPVEIGLAVDNYYERPSGKEDTFGYLSFGLGASMPLSFMPESAGTWTLSGSVKAFYFGDTLAAANEGDDWYPVAMGSIGVEF